MKVFLVHFNTVDQDVLLQGDYGTKIDFFPTDENVLVSQLKSSKGADYLVVFGPEKLDITPILNAIHHFEKSIQVLAIQPKKEIGLLKQSLMFSPFSGKSTTCVHSEEPLVDSLKNFISKNEKKRQFNSLLKNTQESFENLETFRKKVQTVLGNILQQMPIGVFLIDNSDKLISVNQFGNELVGKSKSDLTGKLITSQFPESQKSTIEKALTEMMEHEIELLVNGETKYFNISCNSIDEGERVVVLNNITEQKKALLAMEQLTYIAAHDLQEPLRGIQGLTQVLQMDYSEELDEQGSQLIGYVNNAAKRMSDLIHALFEYSRVGHNNEYSLFSVEQIVRDVLLDLRIKIEESQATIKLEDLPELEANQIEIRMLFQNLIGNALKFRKTDVAPIIQISAAEQEKEWLFSIRDNGIGIENEFKEQVFVIFKRLNVQSEYPGTGIGLTHCKKIVEAHLGKIWIESLPGEGSTFFFTLPKA